MIKYKECYNIKDLKINGNDLKELGYKGNNIGKNLNFIDESSLNKIDIKYILKEIGYNKFEKILNLKNMYYSNVLNKENKYIELCIKSIKDIINNKECYNIKDLEVNGNDLKKLGYKGNNIGKNLNYLLEEVIKNPNLNNKELLIKRLNKI